MYVFLVLGKLRLHSMKQSYCSLVTCYMRLGDVQALKWSRLLQTTDSFTYNTFSNATEEYTLERLQKWTPE